MDSQVLVMAHGRLVVEVDFALQAIVKAPVQLEIGDLATVDIDGKRLKVVSVERNGITIYESLLGRSIAGHQRLITTKEQACIDVFK